MARFIPVDGPVGSEESFVDLILRLYGGRSRLVSFTHLDASQEIIVSPLDVVQVNKEATALAGGKTIYGDAVVYRAEEALM